MQEVVHDTRIKDGLAALILNINGAPYNKSCKMPLALTIEEPNEQNPYFCRTWHRGCSDQYEQRGD